MNLLFSDFLDMDAASRGSPLTPPNEPDYNLLRHWARTRLVSDNHAKEAKRVRWDIESLVKVLFREAPCVVAAWGFLRWS